MQEEPERQRRSKHSGGDRCEFNLPGEFALGLNPSWSTKMVKSEGKEHWTPFQSRLGMVRLVLSVVWDPIGIFGNNSTLDEYDNYSASVLEVAEKTKSPERIAEFLAQIERNQLRVRNDSNDARILAARKILQILDNCRE